MKGPWEHKKQEKKEKIIHFEKRCKIPEEVKCNWVLKDGFAFARREQCGQAEGKLGSLCRKLGALPVVREVCVRGRGLAERSVSHTAVTLRSWGSSCWQLGEIPKAWTLHIAHTLCFMPQSPSVTKLGIR